jgi:Tol biopolymer transport system component
LQSLWRVAVSGDVPKPVAGVGGPAIKPSISRRGNHLVYQQAVENDNIWRIDLKDETHTLGSPVREFSSRGFIRRPSFSPNGKKVAFESDRLGYSDIWVCDSDGSNCAQVTSLHTISGTARWSPDGQYLAFESAYQHFWQLYTVQVPGGEPHLMGTLAGNNGTPNWSRDGQWIYFYSEQRQYQIWKVPSKGGTPVQVTKDGGVYGIESEDERSLYYTGKPNQAGIWRMSLDGGDETHVLDEPLSWYNWVLTRTGIYFIDEGVQPEVPEMLLRHVNGRIEFLDFATREIIPIFSIEKPVSAYGGLALSRDGKSLFYGQTDRDDSYIMLVKNFR